MKVSETFSLEIEMSEFYKFAIPLIPKRELNSAIKAELKQCLGGIFHGGWGGTAISWERALYISLYHNNAIKQTELSKKKFGDFSNLES